MTFPPVSMPRTIRPFGRIIPYLSLSGLLLLICFIAASVNSFSIAGQTTSPRAQRQYYRRRHGGSSSTVTTIMMLAPSSSSTASSASPPTPEQVGLRGLYPPSVAHTNGTLVVDDMHTLYYEIHGQGGHPHLPEQQPFLTALFLHGGPGAGCFPNHARFFDPNQYRIVLLDQRGCGQSTPRGEARQNTLMDIVQDCERLRLHLGLARFDVTLGGSWGCTVAVAYAQAYPHSVGSIVLRGVCLMRPAEVDWLFSNQGGMARTSPENWKTFAAAVDSPEVHPRDALHAYYDCLLGNDQAVRIEAARSWMKWEFSAFTSSSNKQKQPGGGDGFYEKAYAPVAVYQNGEWQWQDGQGNALSIEVQRNLGLDGAACKQKVQSLRQGHTDSEQIPMSPPQTLARPLRSVEHRTLATNKLELSPEAQAFVPAQNMLTCFYSVNDRYATNNMNFLDPHRLAALRDIPCIAVQGGRDRICPVDTALDLLAQWSQMELRIPTESGHSMYDVAITNELVRATDRLVNMLK